MRQGLIKKLAKNNSGFSLTEIMIGIMILTIAIVAATNLLVGLIATNRTNLSTLQAYYLAQEGIEAVRNIRDSNWLHNQDWLGGTTSFWGNTMRIGEDYSIALEYGALNRNLSELSGGIEALNSNRPWTIDSSERGEIYLVSNGDNEYLSSAQTGEDTGFKRTISLKTYECDQVDCSDFVLVESKVEWFVGDKNDELVLSTVLTNWKGGAI